MAYSSRFNFKGELVIPKNASNGGDFAKKWIGGASNNLPMISLNFGIKKGSQNIGFVEMFGMKSEKIYTSDKNKKQITIDRADVMNQEEIDRVVQYKKIIVDLGSEYGGRHEFIDSYEAAEFIGTSLPTYKGKVRVTGDFVKQISKGKVYNKFIIKHLYAVKEEDSTTDQLKLTLDLFYNKESIDKADFKKEKKIYVQGYIQQFFTKNQLGEDKGRKLFIQQDVVFSGDQIADNLLDYKLKYIDIKNKTMMHIPWDCAIVNGAEEVDFDKSMLTSQQKEQIDLGIKELSDFTPKDKLLGNKVSEIRLKDPVFTGNYVNGLIDSEYTNREFEDEVFFIAEPEKISDMQKKTKPEKVEEVEETKEVEEVKVFNDIDTSDAEPKNVIEDDSDLF